MDALRHSRNIGEEWINIKNALGERGINIAGWCRANMPVTRQWLDRHAELFKNWKKFLVARKWANGVGYASRRQSGLEYALDLIALSMGAGATFTEAVRTVVREQTDAPFHVELRTMLAEMDLGTVRSKALVNMADRVPLDTLRSIVGAVVQAEELGTPLGQVLHDQATLLRDQRSVRAENAAAAASVRILLPCMLLVLAVLLTVFSPIILKMLHGGLF